MKKLLSLILLLLGIGFSSQAQDICDSTDFQTVYSASRDAYWSGDYALSIEGFSCAIALIPADVEANGGLLIGDDYAGAYLNRGWAYLQSGDYAAVHSDFYRWIELTETVTLEQDLLETVANGNFSIDGGMVYRLSFEGQAGQILGFAALTQDSIDPLLVLLAPDGSVVISDDDGGINLDAVIRRYTLLESGSYTLVLGQAGGWGSGEIELALYQDGAVSSSNPENTNVAFSFAAYYLFAGETAEVFTTNGDNLNVRSGPGTGYDILDRLELGELVTLIEGPYKEDGGYAWWFIRTSDGIEGYAVERVETEQTLQLAMFTGEEALVTSAPDLLNVRENPTRSSDVIFQLEDGAVVTLLEDLPVFADGLRWWHLRDAEGREGWAVDRIGIERTLAPLREFPTS